MGKYYEEILKEQIMQGMLGYNHVTTQQYLKQLMNQNVSDIQEITNAYDVVMQEISGLTIIKSV